MPPKKTKIIFINPMGVLTNAEFYKNNEKAFDERQLSENLVKYFKNVIHDYNVKLVFLDTWAESEKVLIEKLKTAGFHDIESYFHSMIKHPLFSKISKSEQINEVLNLEKESCVVIDNNTQVVKYSEIHKQKGIFTDINLGLTANDLLELRRRIEA